MPLLSKQARHHRIFFFGVLAVAVAVSIILLKNYISLIVVSLVYSILIRPLYEQFHTKYKWQEGIAAIATVSITFFTIVIPLLFIGTLVTREAFSFRQDISMLINSETISIQNSVNSINDALLSIPGMTYQLTDTEVENTLGQIAGPIGTFIANQLINIGTSSAFFIVNLFIFLVLVFFTVPSLGKLQTYALRLSPLPDNIDKLYMQRILSMIRAMIKGTFLVALVQGVLAGLLLMIMGVQYILVLTIIMTLFSTIPILSTTLVTLPVAIYFIFTGSLVKGIIIILVQALVISTIDNIMRPMLASGEGHLHPGLLLLAILGGIQIFGFLGLFYGPIILIFLTTSLEVYEKYYR